MISDDFFHGKGKGQRVIDSEDQDGFIISWNKPAGPDKFGRSFGFSPENHSWLTLPMSINTPTSRDLSGIDCENNKPPNCSVEGSKGMQVWGSRHRHKMVVRSLQHGGFQTQQWRPLLQSIVESHTQSSIQPPQPI